MLQVSEELCCSFSNWNVMEYQNNSIFLLFDLAPLNIVQPLTDVNVLLGQSGTLSFVCDAFPAPKVTWYVNFFDQSE